ncbi:hypothetical protein [Morganella sp. HMSC11D09]|nr:hypothetical protein [Morganella sp. HMSC11D09]
MSKQESIAKMLKLANRLDEIVAELTAKKDEMFSELYSKAA